MRTVHELATFHLDQARRAIRTASRCTAASQHGKRWRHARAYWQHIAAFHRQEFKRLARECRRLDEYRAAYGRNQRALPE